MIENKIFFIIIKILNIVGILNIKGMGNETLIGLLHIMPKTHPLPIKRIGTTRLDHATDCFPRR